MAMKALCIFRVVP